MPTISSFQNTGTFYNINGHKLASIRESGRESGSGHTFYNTK